MSRHVISVLIFSLMILTGSAQFAAADIPVEPYIEASFATDGPLSLFSAPDGGGNPFTQAFGPNGQTVDGTLTIILYDDMPPWGNPVANYPKADIWLEDHHGELVSCQGGTIPDEDTDDVGMTFWTHPLRVGSHAEPVDGNQLAIVVTGWILDSPSLEDFRINSADLNGDLHVNLSDIAMFVGTYFGTYDYASDFHWDGVLNLADIVLLAESLGAECP